jgi:RNase P/RNase MRP subunit POP5
MPVRNIRRRYLLFDVNSEISHDEKEIWETIRNSIQGLYGVKGLSLIDPNLIEYNQTNSKGIIRCTHDSERYLRASLASITDVATTPAALRISRSSGTLHALRKKSGLDKPKKEAVN